MIKGCIVADNTLPSHSIDWEAVDMIVEQERAHTLSLLQKAIE